MLEQERQGDREPERPDPGQVSRHLLPVSSDPSAGTERRSTDPAHPGAAGLLAHSGVIDFPLARAWMCAELRARWVSEDVLMVLAGIPRHAFAPPDRWRVAYLDQHLWTGTTWMTSPVVVGRTVDALPRDRRVRTLEIGTGTGYQTAVLAGMGHEVVSVDVSHTCVAGARNRLRALGAADVELFVANGLGMGRPVEHFDAVVLNAALPAPPTRLVSLLKPAGGVLVVPTVVADGSQRLLRYDISEGTGSSADLGPCRFELVIPP